MGLYRILTQVPVRPECRQFLFRADYVACYLLRREPQPFGQAVQNAFCLRQQFGVRQAFHGLRRNKGCVYGNYPGQFLIGGPHRV